jgi:hypothetical protein
MISSALKYEILRSAQNDKMGPWRVLQEAPMIRAIGSWRPGYDGVDLDFFFFWLGFRHPADFFAIRQPGGFFA